MKIIITKDLLRQKGACDPGVLDFEREFGARWEVEWTPDAQLEFIRGPLRKYLGWAIQQKLLPMWSLSGANLSGANLFRANLERAINVPKAICKGNVR